ncbi:MAG: hypothetical protein RBR69_04495, partial [Candidatus Cloacimonadaceae bacterium]|nr:hypothetical protein [Candidatus Cloacimonadaceae bacterium]
PYQFPDCPAKFQAFLHFSREPNYGRVDLYYLKYRPYRTLSYCVAVACYLKYRPYRTQGIVQI